MSVGGSRCGASMGIIGARRPAKRQCSMVTSPSSLRSPAATPWTLGGPLPQEPGSCPDRRPSALPPCATSLWWHLSPAPDLPSLASLPGAAATAQLSAAPSSLPTPSRPLSFKAPLGCSLPTSLRQRARPCCRLVESVVGEMTAAGAWKPRECLFWCRA